MGCFALGLPWVLTLTFLFHPAKCIVFLPIIQTDMNAVMN
uniref:Uncharacterized protein n=1 Tax=Anguilla anguilla TaxID=7936 RepID=A0A0E9PG31_ANGAN